MIERPDPTEEEVSRWIRSSDNFHLLFYQYCGNSRLVRAAQKLRSQLTIFSFRYETDLEVQRSIDACHHDIFAAYEAGDIPGAERLYVRAFAAVPALRYRHAQKRARPGEQVTLTVSAKLKRSDGRRETALESQDAPGEVFDVFGGPRCKFQN